MASVTHLGKAFQQEYVCPALCKALRGLDEGIPKAQSSLNCVDRDEKQHRALETALVLHVGGLCDCWAPSSSESSVHDLG